LSKEIYKNLSVRYKANFTALQQPLTVITQYQQKRKERKKGFLWLFASTEAWWVFTILDLCMLLPFLHSHSRRARARSFVVMGM